MKAKATEMKLIFESQFLEAANSPLYILLITKDC